MTQATGEEPEDPYKDMPQYDLLYALVDLYFKHINTWFRFFTRRTTLDAMFGPVILDEPDKIILHAIVATTMRYCTDPRLTDERRESYHQMSKERVLLYGMENSTVKSLQALVILALDICGSRNGPPGWNIMALITRSVVQLGLAVESNSFSVSPGYKSIYTLRAMVLPEAKDFVEESRRRLFWMNTCSTGTRRCDGVRDALSDKEIDRTLPCRDDLWMANRKSKRDGSRPGPIMGRISRSISEQAGESWCLCLLHRGPGDPVQDPPVLEATR